MNPLYDALLAVLIARGFDEDEIHQRLAMWEGTASEMVWQSNYLDEAIDNLAYALGYKSAYPDSDS